MTAFVIALVAAFVLLVLVRVPPRALADFLRVLWPLFLLGGGLLLTLIGRAGLGVPMIGFGVMAWMRRRAVGKMSGGSAGTSSVRSAGLEMHLDHESGDMDGEVLAGPNEGRLLSELDELELMELHLELRSDGESLALLEAYLDRRLPHWRENAEGDAGSREHVPASTGPMTEKEAYEVLGLQPGAGANAIREAHRRLMKSVHPDSGGSTFLAAKINEAKDVLLSGH
ncbi:MAG: DnaJ domain-containing protein [Pseudomonadota bacterium]